MERDVEPAEEQAQRRAQFLQGRASWQRQCNALGQTAAAGKGEPLTILNAILPEASKAKAKAIVSTHRGNYPTIPRTDLLVEIGNRVSNTRNYDAAFRQAKVKTSEVPKFAEYEKESFAEPQPLRTDLERMLGSQGFIDVEIE
jgi:hypothetical protein